MTGKVSDERMGIGIFASNAAFLRSGEFALLKNGN